ncbi:MAG: hypothetical protein AAF862_03565 [Pseudomonadota bacterium]
MARAPLSLFSVTASTAKGDAWLRDGVHLRMDFSDALGFPASPFVVVWGQSKIGEGKSLERPFSPSILTPAQAQQGGTKLLAYRTLPHTPDLEQPMPSWQVSPQAPLNFMLEGDDIAWASVKSATGPITIKGIVDSPSGPRALAQATGTQPELCGALFQRIEVSSARGTTIPEIKLVSRTDIESSKTWQNLSRNGQLNALVTVDAALRIKRLPDAQRTTVSRTGNYITMTLRGTAAAMQAQPNAFFPAINGRAPNADPPDIIAARLQRRMAGMQADLDGFMEELSRLLNADGPQRSVMLDASQDQRDERGALTNKTTAQLPLFAKLYLQTEDPIFAMMSGRRLALPFAPPAILGATGNRLTQFRELLAQVPVSVGALWALPDQTLDAMPDLARIAIPRENVAAMMLEDQVSGGMFLPPFLADHSPENFVFLQSRILASLTPNGPPEAPRMFDVPVADPFVPNAPFRRAEIEAHVGPAAALTLDSIGSDVKRLNPQIPIPNAQQGDPPHYQQLFGALPQKPFKQAGKTALPVSLRDDKAALEGLTYRVAQRDGFGRWSSYAQVNSSMPERPKPPQPILRLDWRADATGQHAGMLRADIIAPHRGMLAPGGRALKTLFVRFQVGTRSFTDEHSIGPLPPAPSETAPERVLTSTFTVEHPDTHSAEGRPVTVTAWFDDSEQTPGPEAVLTKQVQDARPPAGPPPVPTLRPLSHPSPAGVCRAELVLTGFGDGAEFVEIEAASEAAIRREILAEHPSLKSEIEALKEEPKLAARAQGLKAFEDRIGAAAWGPSGSTPIIGDKAIISHRVNGQPRDLVALRLRTRSAFGVLSEDAQIVYFGLPSGKPLKPPSLEVKMVDSGDGTAAFDVLIKRPSGPQPNLIRILRSTVTDLPSQMMPVAEIVVEDEPTWPIVLRDQGQTTFGKKATLPHYRPILWRAQCASQPRFSGAPQSPWTEAGPVARAQWAPQTPPQPPGARLLRNASGLQLLLANIVPSMTEVISVAITPSLALPAGDGSPLIIAATDESMDVDLPVDADALRTLTITAIDPAGRSSEPVILTAEQMIEPTP